MTITDWIQAGSAAIVAVLTFFLRRLARRQTDLLDHSVKVAQQSAEAAQKSAEVAEKALIGTQRPLLKISFDELQIDPPNKTTRAEVVRTTVYLTNIGREPAVIAKNAVQFVPHIGPGISVPQPGARPFDAIWSITDLDDGLLVTPGNAVGFEVSRYLNADAGEVMENFSGIRGRLFIYGIVVYDDLIGIRREFGFTFGWDIQDRAFFRCGTEGHNYDRIIEPTADPIVITPMD